MKGDAYSNFADWLKESLHDVSIKTVLSHDLYLYVREEPRLFGLQDEFLLSPRLDDLSSAFSVLDGFLSTNSDNAIAVYALFDNEEVGSLTRQGANSTFLKETLSRIAACLWDEKDALPIAVADGFHLSVDNAHANHPNHPELFIALGDRWLIDLVEDLPDMDEAFVEMFDPSRGGKKPTLYAPNLSDENTSLATYVWLPISFDENGVPLIRYRREWTKNE